MADSIDWRRELRARLGDLAGIETLRLIEAAQDVAAEHGVIAPVSDAWLAAMRAPDPDPDPGPRAETPNRVWRGEDLTCSVCSRSGGRDDAVTTDLNALRPPEWTCAPCAAATDGEAPAAEWRAPAVLDDAYRVAALPSVGRSPWDIVRACVSPAGKRCILAVMRIHGDADPQLLADRMAAHTWRRRGMAGDAPRPGSEAAGA